MPIHIDKDDRGVVTVKLDNVAKRNAMDDGMLKGLADLLEEATHDANIRMVVIRGANGCFCSGRDLGELSGLHPGTPASRLLPINQLAQAFRRCSVPVVSLVEGKAAGLGVSLVCWSDIAIAAADASFSLPEARAGIAPSVTAVSLIAVLGRRRAMDLCLTGRSINAEAALQIGLVHYFDASSEIESALDSVVHALLRGGPQALRLTKQLGMQAEGMDFDGSMAAANATAERSMSGEEIQEGLAALREKRAPAWMQP
jgi:enoyl-CoA hydratase/carnithine racemase